MPWSAKLVLILGAVLLLPLVGEYAAVFVLFIAALPLGIAAPIVRGLSATFGYEQYWSAIYIAAIAAGAAALAAFFVFKLRSQSSNEDRSAFYLNGLILTVGLPLLLAVSYLRVEKLFGGL